MNTAFGVLLFLVVYVPVAYMVYDELSGRRSRVRLLIARGPRPQRTRERLELVSGSQR